MRQFLVFLFVALLTPSLAMAEVELQAPAEGSAGLEAPPDAPDKPAEKKGWRSGWRVGKK